MSLTRTPAQMALGEAGSQCREIAELCRDAAGEAVEPRVGALLARLAQMHEGLLDGLDRRLRALDDLPLTPDPDRNTLKKIATRAKELFVADDDRLLLDERLDDERALEAHARSALETELDAETRACLEAVRRVAAEALGLLEAERACHAA